MVAVFAGAEGDETPVTIPVLDPTVATAVLLLLQLPPGTASDNNVVEPKQATNMPVIVPGVAVTVTTTVATQPDTK